MEGAAGHAAPVDLDPIHLRCLPDGDGPLDGLKDTLSHAYSPPLLGDGGLYPAALARSLAALRRSSLYGSRTDTQRFGHREGLPVFFYDLIRVLFRQPPQLLQQAGVMGIDLGVGLGLVVEDDGFLFIRESFSFVCRHLSAGQTPA